jgi:hypothetical protein
VEVVGIKRVAVNEKEWQSWLLTTQGVITFSVWPAPFPQIILAKVNNSQFRTVVSSTVSLPSAATL